jgi:hypothetical protein
MLLTDFEAMNPGKRGVHRFRDDALNHPAKLSQTRRDAARLRDRARLSPRLPSAMQHGRATLLIDAQAHRTGRYERLASSREVKPALPHEQAQANWHLCYDGPSDTSYHLA